MSARPMIVGEAPTEDCVIIDERLSRVRRRGFRYVALTGRTGRRLATMLDVDDVAGVFDVANLYDEPAPRWSAPEARQRALRIVLERYDVCHSYVLLGRRVAAAFQVPTYVPFSTRYRHVFSYHERRGHPWSQDVDLDVLVVPHPSGRNRLYNDGAVWWKAAHAMRAMVRP